MSYKLATYKGHTYSLIWMGDTKFGKRAHLQFTDGSKNFWCDASLVTVTPNRTGYVATEQAAYGKRRSGGIFCAECGEKYVKGQRCWETGGECIPERE